MIKEDTELWNVVVNDLLSVYSKVKDLKYIPVPAECEKHTTIYLDENDKIKSWFDENIERVQGEKIKARDLYNNYVSWAGNDPKKLSETLFGRTMIDRFKVEKVKNHGVMTYLNVRFVIHENSDSDDE